MTVYVPTLQKHYALNSSILSRSPVLFQRIRDESPCNTKQPLELDLYVLPETFHTIIGHLNRPLTPQEIMFLVHEKPHIAVELLEACEELGLDQLMHVLLATLNQHMNPATIMIYTEAMAPYQPLEEEEPRRWVEILERDIVSFLMATFKEEDEDEGVVMDDDEERRKTGKRVMFGQVNVTSSRNTLSARLDALSRCVADLPPHLMIRCLEHPHLPVQNSIQSSVFAKEVLSRRSDRDMWMVVLRFARGKDSIAVVKQTGLKKGKWDPTLYN